MENIDEPLQNVPFNKFHNNLGNSSNIRKFFLHKTSVQGLLVNMHLFPRTERGEWNKALKKNVEWRAMYVFFRNFAHSIR